MQPLPFAVSTIREKYTSPRFAVQEVFLEYLQFHKSTLIMCPIVPVLYEQKGTFSARNSTKFALKINLSWKSNSSIFANYESCVLPRIFQTFCHDCIKKVKV